MIYWYCHMIYWCCHVICWCSLVEIVKLWVPASKEQPRPPTLDSTHFLLCHVPQEAHERGHSSTRCYHYDRTPQVTWQVEWVLRACEYRNLSMEQIEALPW